MDPRRVGSGGDVVQWSALCLPGWQTAQSETVFIRYKRELTISTQGPKTLFPNVGSEILKTLLPAAMCP